MRLSIITLVIVSSLIFGTQVIALFLQYRVNKSYKGPLYWLIGSSLLGLSLILMPLVAFPASKIRYLAIFANPLLISGHIFLYIGIKRFLDIKTKKWIPILIFILFNLFYFYNMFIDDVIAMRAVVISGTIAIISFMIVCELLFKKDILLSKTINFNAAVFFIYGCAQTLRVIITFFSKPGNTYIEQGYNIIFAVSFSAIISNLWTFGLITMVNQRLNIENQSEKEKLQLIFNANTNGQLITRFNDGFIVDVNDEFSLMSGYSKGEVIGKCIEQISFWKKEDERETFNRQMKENGNCVNLDFVFKRKDESLFPSVVSARIITIYSEAHIISVISDITERKEFEKALIESEGKYRSVLNASPDDITITDLDGRIVMISPAAKEIFGYDWDYDNFIGMKLLDFIVAEDVERAKSNILLMCEGSKRTTNEYRGVKQDKSTFDIEVNSGMIYDANRLPDKMVFIIRDITERKIIEAEMEKLVQQLEIERNTAQLNSITDSLTGLYNRGYFDNMLRTEFFRLMRLESPLSLIMLDIDHFKNFNDSYGHLVGDKCLQMISNMLKNVVKRAPDIVARYGGEEFIIILPDTDEKGAKTLGEIVRKSVEGLAIPHVSSKTAKYVTVSVGITTIYPAELEFPDEVLKLVDEALYQAKENGRNCSVFWK